MAHTLDADQVQYVRDLCGYDLFKETSQIYSWTESQVDPLAKANTPLLKRPAIPSTLKKLASSNVFLMNDYRNGLCKNWYEACQGQSVTSKEYVCEYWQSVEVFNYFGHCRVMIPPPVWINAAHRNGTVVLGTFILEGGAASGILDKLESDNTKYKLADYLYRMAKCYGFDGWLMNFETRLAGTWDGGNQLSELLKQLKQKVETNIPGGRVIWYDALNTSNNVEWQNTVNSANAIFAKSAGSIITNYGWDLNTLSSATSAASGVVPLNNLYMGIDCWAQTGRYAFGFDEEVKLDDNGAIIDQAKLKNSSGTGRGHGGLATGTAVNALAHAGTSVGLFAQGWAYEHYPDGTQVDRYMWEGTPELNLYLKAPIQIIPPEIQCRGTECTPYGSLGRHLRADFSQNPISRFATRWAAGSDSFFHSDYGSAYVTTGEGKYDAHLGQQSVLPPPGERTVPVEIIPMTTAAGNLVADMKDAPSRCAISLVITKGNGLEPQTQFKAKLPLHNLNIDSALNADIIVSYEKTVADNRGVKIQLFADVGGKTLLFDLTGLASKHETQTIPIRNVTGSITAVGVLIQGPAQIYNIDNNTADLINIFGMTVKPTGSNYTPTAIQNVQLIPWGKDKTAHARLKWTLASFSAPPKALPVSDITGPFSHFLVSADGVKLGRAYALAFILNPAMYSSWKTARKASVTFTIAGIAFDGTRLGDYTGALTLI